VSPSEYWGQSVLLVTTSDITKRLKTEQQLIQASKMATLGEMATGVAHELNQPLSVIKTASSFLVKKIENGQSIKENIMETMLAKVDANVDRATKIINHMRQFARKSDMKLAPIDVHTVLESAFEIFSQQLKVRGIDIQRSFSPDLPPINADPDRLEQVFINLLLNARDAIEERCARHPAGREMEKKIRLTTGLDGERVFVEVCDSGVGIPTHIAHKIFEPFFTTKEVGKGTGLGLSISYGIVKDCGGIIDAVPNSPRGTCFVLKFPRTEEAAAPATTTENAEPAHG
jgi:histidine kinase